MKAPQSISGFLQSILDDRLLPGGVVLFNFFKKTFRKLVFPQGILTTAIALQFFTFLIGLIGIEKLLG